jgi:hypothetical protein
MRIVDNLAAIRFIWLLSTPFEKFDAYKLGLIDANGVKLKKAETPEEKNSTSMLHRLVWNLKRIIALAPGGKTRIGSLVAAYLLVKEAYENDYEGYQLEEEIVSKFQLYRDIHFIEEEVFVEEVLKQLYENEGGVAPTNSTGPAVSTDQVRIDGKTRRKLKKFTGLRRKIIEIPA